MIAELEKKLEPSDTPRTVDKAIEAYEVARRELGRSNAADTTYRLRQLLAGALDMPLGRLTPERCAALYEALRTQPRANGKTLAVDSHRNMLAEGKTFGAWCVERGWLRLNPLAAVKGVGVRNHGKPQLRIDEARRWLALALDQADAGEEGALGALLALLMGLRAGEISGLASRDVDDEGRLLWVNGTKTAAARRTLQVPKVLQPLLVEAKEGKLPTAPLLGHHDRSFWRKSVTKLCVQAKVPKVCAHAMRGLHATLGLVASSTPHEVAAALGHTSVNVTRESYAEVEAVEVAQSTRALRVLEGGRP